jgi:predicted enzyme related to lactoylglutathione lyase
MAHPFVHIELNTTDPDKAKTFYTKMFDWQLEDMPMGPSKTYTMIKPGEGPGGGLLKHPMPGAPSMWLVYVDVADVKAETAKAKSLGAKVEKEVTEVPGMGWFSILSDPTGAGFALWQAAKKG